MPAIETSRLRLIPASLESLRAELEQPARLGEVLGGVSVPDNWPPDLYDRDPIEYTLRRLQEVPSDDGWWLHYFVLRASDTAPEIAIGCGGYKGGPSEDGTVEIGYSVLSQFRRCGYATEASRAFIASAFACADVTAVSAHTYPELIPSIGVLQKCGFTLAGAGAQPGVIRYELTRAAWEAQ